MIPSRPSPWLKFLFGFIVQKRMQKTFAELQVFGLEQLRVHCARGPVLFVSNHTAWWDPMFLILLSARVLRLRGYAMMDAKNLRKLPFLGRLGGFGVDLDDSADRSAGLSYAQSLLKGPGDAVWIFPQGEERPDHERELQFQPGAAVLAQRQAEAQVIPVGFRYVFGKHEKPSMFVSIAAPLEPTGSVETDRLAQVQAVVNELQRIDAFLSHADTQDSAGFVRLLQKRPGFFSRLLTRALGLMTR